MATREVVLEKKVDTKYMQINVLRNIAKHDKKGDDIPLDSHKTYDMLTRFVASVLMG